MGLALLLAAYAPAMARTGLENPPVRISISNKTNAALQCQVLFAHWYSGPAIELPSASALSLEFTAHSGTEVITGAAANGLPVERLFCGLYGHAWETRLEIDLHALARRAFFKQPPEVVCPATQTPAAQVELRFSASGSLVQLHDVARLPVTCVPGN